MPTSQDEVEFSQMTRIGGQTEQVALDVETEAGKNRAYISSIERFSTAVGKSITLNTTAQALHYGDTNLLNRRGIFLQNQGTIDFIINFSSDMTTGWKIGAGAGHFFAFSDNITVYGKSSANCNIFIIEGA